jgi:hypothetical protein
MSISVNSRDAVTDRSGHAVTPVGVSVCFTPGFSSSAPNPVAYPAAQMAAQVTAQTKQLATKLAPVGALQLRTQLNTLHSQLSSGLRVDLARWMALLNEYVQTASALYSRGAGR